jgi:ribosome-binding protein aMBF1 (putative translation factor)
VITGEQVKAARKLLGWSRDRLGPKAGMNTSCLGLIENGKREMRPDESERLLAALESAGVEFTNGEAPGVRLRKPPLRIL